MGKPSAAHLGMRELLTRMQVPFDEEIRVAGHRIDFVVWHRARYGLGVDVNGDRWHHWPKIVACDRVKLDRVFRPGVEPLVLGVWWSRLQRSPESVEEAIRLGLEAGRLAWWDWAVEIDSLSPESSARVRSLVAAE